MSVVPPILCPSLIPLKCLRNLHLNLFFSSNSVFRTTVNSLDYSFFLTIEKPLQKPCFDEQKVNPVISHGFPSCVTRLRTIRRPFQSLVRLTVDQGQLLKSPAASNSHSCLRETGFSQKVLIQPKSPETEKTLQVDSNHNKGLSLLSIEFYIDLSRQNAV